MTEEQVEKILKNIVYGLSEVSDLLSMEVLNKASDKLKQISNQCIQTIKGYSWETEYITKKQKDMISMIVYKFNLNKSLINEIKTKGEANTFINKYSQKLKEIKNENNI